MTQKISWAQYLGVVGQIGFIIAIPIVALTLLGRYLDSLYGTSPWLLLSGIILAFLVSSGILYAQVWRTLKFFAEQETIVKKEKTEDTKEIFEDSEFEDDEE
ncbi:MAG: hypothetical protein A3B74_04360 [Candidatus Kerfeldbacteria bacterium RIFCSPHIGHO2_02_FULL_42_14]|uniref:F0F1 ATP synthase subunit n=1 Tax=Candidatus Kerfeldbacteria bacterium RIFCSPHIGHO2_02_FULL_42_14 TaxID=1798540 RepID=A0A1G2AQ15_9BACT|nr:MAG: hypothetical protein A3B74_04360 [Candidatus Kerfeldbacteria bacterium RIFCSPHIGHO2_02_FULL_42_14]OGY80831.1 MAG: hypothetical protein A3E60_01460 [Candidatus Kerfeldbacteria bacterium RIFCSPHIGHO2_12_FULL_42_13]OGY85003.1 MAG: hypothetical protein A3I91_00795 [Candidatus Kerfeldbacteria bacterium RIFCSPLOWO2_02_FULL_42_19]OGY86907.1 MAG: hypothetical protein A3G01_04490 [Candidatus Kerfeldbacteria bacterium RIFCSPLOWO2_12_FULL_43_9]